MLEVANDYEEKNREEGQGIWDRLQLQSFSEKMKFQQRPKRRQQSCEYLANLTCMPDTEGKANAKAHRQKSCLTD